MRRSSLVAPLLLIALGVLFLARNLYPELPLTAYVSRYWPYILIAWGAIRAAEICYWALSSKPLPSSGVSGGEWALVLFVCLIGIGMHAAQGAERWWQERIPWAGVPWASMQVMGERYDYPVHAEKPSSKSPHIVIDDFRGDLQIVGSDADVLKVTGRKSIRAMDKTAAEKADQNSTFEITGDSNEMTVRLREGSGFGPRISSALRKSPCPRARASKPNAAMAPCISQTCKARWTVGGRAGDMDVHDIGGPVNIDLKGPSPATSCTKNLTKAVRFKTPRTEFSAAAVPGQIHLDSGDFNADGLTGPTRLSARSRRCPHYAISGMRWRSTWSAAI